MGPDFVLLFFRPEPFVVLEVALDFPVLGWLTFSRDAFPDLLLAEDRLADFLGMKVSELARVNANST